jgi:hypothetical protein
VCSHSQGGGVVIVVRYRVKGAAHFQHPDCVLRPQRGVEVHVESPDEILFVVLLDEIRNALNTPLPNRSGILPADNI